MLVTHTVDDRRISKDVNSQVGFLLTNRKGGFINLGISSRYRGLFFPYQNDLLKLIDEIRISDELKEIRNQFWNISREYQNVSESFFMPFGTESLVYELNNEKTIEILFDVKKAYDNRNWGRNYNITENNGKILVEFTKLTDSREDQTNSIHEYTVFMAIKPISPSSINILNEWENVSYGYDKSRNSYPNERYVLKGLRLNSKGFVLAFSDNKDHAFMLCDKISSHMEKYKHLQKKYSKVSIKQLKNEKVNFAAKCAIESLDSLIVINEPSINLYAGLPWFFQFWSRDTMISLNALLLDKEYVTVKKILMTCLNHLTESGFLPNRIPGTTLGSADAIGWYFKRWDDLITALRKENHLKTYFKKSEILFIIEKLEDSMNKIFKSCTVDSLAINNPGETWMDTSINGEGRSGARIEMQALRICMYNLLFKLTDSKVYKDMADKLSSKIRDQFWTGSCLKDGSTDSTIRPNIFIAAYLCPDLLTHHEWSLCFETALPKLWLDWGGLSTIDKTDSRFISYHSGEDSKSYHNGDSWYWINNLAALAMARLDYHKFKHYVDKILDASTEEILYNGYIGCHSEISSAAEQRSFGCLSQAWSNALYIELVEELNSKHIHI